MTASRVNLNPLCGCRAVPVNVWYRDGEEIERRELTMTTGAKDGEDFLASGADSFLVVCPECDQLFVAGGRE